METQQYKSSKRRENRKTGLKILICIFVTSMISVFGIVFLTSNLSFLVNWYEKMMMVEYKDISCITIRTIFRRKMSKPLTVF